MTEKKEKTALDSNWPALLRGSVLSSSVQKHIQYVGHADRRALGVITINSILIPLALTQIHVSGFKLASSLFIFGSFLSMLFAIVSLMPKRYHDCKVANLLHFSGISKYDEEDYLDQMMGHLHTREGLSKLMVADLYHLSKDILMPKFRYIRYSYTTFLISVFVALSILFFGYFVS